LNVSRAILKRIKCTYATVYYEWFTHGSDEFVM